MKSQSKYMLAGSILAGVGTVYALQRNVDVDILANKIEENKDSFAELLEDLAALAVEFLEKLIRFIQKLIKQLIFKVKVSLNI